MGPGDLAKALKGLNLKDDPNLLVGIGSSDDAGVYKLSEEIAIVQTLDFFTPIADDPLTFGMIAAANSMSDVYAMGGKPLTAMNIVCFPSGKMDISILRNILKGGAQKVHEAGAFLLGGHSVNDSELKYGLSVTGIINPHKLVTNIGGKPGDGLILTKPLGSGIITTAIKKEIADNKITDLVIQLMCTLNNIASTVMTEIGVNACTDITGFGLIGHLLEMLRCEVGARIYADKIPILPKVLDFAEKGIMPGGTKKNRDYYTKLMITDVDTHIVDVLNDPQTSGGLLMAVPPDKVDLMLNKLTALGIIHASLIGHLTDHNKGKVEIL
ncbi:selenide, water dikinase SelD [bacterium]|nr:selenide, water dikinase SelD [bacterium]